MKITNIISTISLLFTTLGTTATSPSSSFPTISPFTQGHWVKIKTGKTGVYQLTDAELRSMGFEPGNIRIYGRGGTLQPTQFVSSRNESYSSELQPVAIKYRNGVTYFYAQGTQKVDYQYSNDKLKDAQRFELESNQVYVNEVSYFITDIGERREIEAINEGRADDTKPLLSDAWTYTYHEIDTHTYELSGRDFYGESLLNKTRLFVPYELPMGKEGGPASITIKFASDAPTQTEMTVGFETGSQQNFKIPATGDYDNFRFNSKRYYNTTLPKTKGNVVVEYDASAAGAKFASLDYIITGARRTFEFAAEEAQFTVYPYEFKSSLYKGLKMPVLTEGCEPGVWQVTNSNEVSELICMAEGEGATVYYLRDNHRGPVVFFDYNQPQLSISSYEEVATQNLHGIGTENIPAMLIITLPELKPAADRLARLHKEKDDVEVAVVLHDEVINEFSAGVDDPMAYRAICKMIYDRDNPDHRVFKHLLLFGPNVRDHRNILGIKPVIGNLISNQTYDSSNYDYSFCINDWYGMMEDETAYEQTSMTGFPRVPMHISVANIPVSTLEQANTYIDKVEHFYNDTSFAQWLNNYSYIADYGQNNEHQNWQEKLYNDMGKYTSDAGIGAKLYSNMYTLAENTKEIYKRLNEGSLVTYFTGHADSNAMANGLLTQSIINNFRNTRLGVMMTGACYVTKFDSNLPGIGSNMVLMKDYGFVASVATTRVCYSSRNYGFLSRLQSALFNEDIKGTTPLSVSRSLGEVYVLAKNNDTMYPNKFAFHLIGDPLIKLPMPTAEVEIDLDGSEGNRVYPGTQIKVNGTVKNRTGKIIEDFNGSAMLRLFSPAMNITIPEFDSETPSVEVKLDNNCVYACEVEITAGEFETMLLIPTDTKATLEEEGMTLRVSAYNPTTRTSGIGALSIGVNEFDAEKEPADDKAPSIESMYAGAPEVTEYDIVSPEFILYADITDDSGVLIYPRDGVPTMYLTIDGTKIKTDLTTSITYIDGGKHVHLAYPMTLAEGTHLVTLTTQDVNGQQVSKSLNIRIGAPINHMTLEIAEEGPARESVTITNIESGAEIRILDAAGRLKHTRKAEATSYVWDLTDSAGHRVPSGNYYAIAVNIQGTAVSVSEPCEIIVFN